jgi:spermidine synthase
MKKNKLIVILALPAAIVVAIAVITSEPSIDVPINSSGFPFLGETVIETVNSEYNNIFVTQTGDVRSMIFGYRGNKYFESAYNIADPEELVFEYTRLMTVGLIYPKKLERGVVLGFGGGRTASYAVRTVPSLTIDGVELDKDIIALGKKHFGVEEGERLSIHTQDGRLFLAQSNETYDIIFLDAYRGPFVPFHLLTKEFYELVRSRLTNGGVVVQNVEPTTMLLDSALATIRSVFPNVDTFSASGNIVLVGYLGEPLEENRLTELAKTFDERFKPRYEAAKMLGNRHPIEPLPNAQVLTDDFAPVEMLNTISRHNQKRQ